MIMGDTDSELSLQIKDGLKYWSKKVHEFTYLGVSIEENEQENARMTKGSKTNGMLRTLITSDLVSKEEITAE